jgi:hypothetical protein
MSEHFYFIDDVDFVRANWTRASLLCDGDVEASWFNLKSGKGLRTLDD